MKRAAIHAFHQVLIAEILADEADEEPDTSPVVCDCIGPVVTFYGRTMVCDRCGRPDYTSDPRFVDMTLFAREVER